MKDFFKKKGLFILLAAVLIAVISIVSASLNGSAVTNGMADTLMKPVRSVTSSFVGSLEKLYNYMYNYDNIEEENRQLKLKVSQLEDEYREYTEVSDENARLRQLLDLKERHSDYNFESATVIGWSSDSFASSFTINKGSSSGLSLYDCIVTDAGYVVGQITEISEKTATVTTILDTSSNIGALIYETGEAGVAQGDFALMQSRELKLSYITASDNVYTGDAVVTSGKGGLFPQGLVIGYISEMVTSGSGLEDYASITPAADFSDLTHVYVITDFTVSD